MAILWPVEKEAVSQGMEDKEKSSYVSLELSPVGAFPLRSVCVPFINMHKRRVHDVSHCYNLEKKWVPPY